MIKNGSLSSGSAATKKSKNKAVYFSDNTASAAENNVGGLNTEGTVKSVLPETVSNSAQKTQNQVGYGNTESSSAPNSSSGDSATPSNVKSGTGGLYSEYTKQTVSDIAPPSKSEAANTGTESNISSQGNTSATASSTKSGTDGLYGKYTKQTVSDIAPPPKSAAANTGTESNISSQWNTSATASSTKSGNGVLYGKYAQQTISDGALPKSETANTGNISSQGSNSATPSNVKSGTGDLYSEYTMQAISGSAPPKTDTTDTEGTSAPTTENSAESTESDTTENTENTDNNENGTGTTDGGTSDGEEQTTESEEEKPLSYAEYIEMLKGEAAESREAADKTAETAKERAIVNAHSSYAQNMATYGETAEKMAQLGLQGGGYGDYLNAQAYAQQRADIQQANAVETAAKSQNETNYRETVNALNQKLLEKTLSDEQSEQERRESIYTALWNSVQDTDTNYTPESLRAIGEEYGLSEAQISSLIGMLATASTKSDRNTSADLKESAKLDIAVNGGEVSDDYIESLKEKGLSDEDAEELQEYIDKALIAAVENKIDNAIVEKSADLYEEALSELDGYYKNGSVTKEKYQEIYTEYADYICDVIMNTDYGTDYTAKISYIIEHKNDMKAMLNAGQITSETYTRIMSVVNLQCKNSCEGGWYIQGLGSGRNNDDVDITIGSTTRKGNGKEYDLLCGKVIGDEVVIAELNRIATGDPKKSPSTAHEHALFGNHNMSSEDKANKLIVAYGDMYLYTKRGWVPLKNDNNNYDLTNAIRKYLG